MSLRPAVALQPIVDLATGTVAAHEALARFHPAWRTDRLLAAAGRTGRADFELAAVTAALAQPVRPLSVNVSAVALADRRILDLLAADADRLWVELTEDVPVADVPAALDSLARLRRDGATIAIDDFGAGHAGLATVAAVLPDIIKLDRQLVARLPLDRLATLAAQLQALHPAALVAEGLAGPGAGRTLASRGVAYGQSYALGRPTAAAAVAAA